MNGPVVASLDLLPGDTIVKAAAGDPATTGAPAPLPAIVRTALDLFGRIRTAADTAGQVVTAAGQVARTPSGELVRQVEEARTGLQAASTLRQWLPVIGAGLVLVTVLLLAARRRG